MTSAVVRISGLTKAYGHAEQQVTVLSSVSLDLNPGEIVLLRGRSGSGKTTLLNVLAGWVDQDAGTVEWDGGGNAGDRRWHQVAIVPQTLGLLEELSIDENVGLALRLGGVTSDDESGRVHGIMERFEIGHLLGRAIFECSLGERQRTAVARALIVAPALLLADEPSAHQDLDRLHVVWSQFREA
ncbi:MAG: ATP-binding cassette domain-containing protein, partial [Actinomycetota bacterium]|nr:ATP-binding cassette domain-containing protein [Actinomycetota bacterium]